MLQREMLLDGCYAASRPQQQRVQPRSQALAAVSGRPCYSVAALSGRPCLLLAEGRPQASRKHGVRLGGLTAAGPRSLAGRPPAGPGGGPRPASALSGVQSALAGPAERRAAGRRPKSCGSGRFACRLWHSMLYASYCIASKMLGRLSHEFQPPAAQPWRGRPAEHLDGTPVRANTSKFTYPRAESYVPRYLAATPLRQQVARSSSHFPRSYRRHALRRTRRLHRKH